MISDVNDEKMQKGRASHTASVDILRNKNHYCTFVFYYIPKLARQYRVANEVLEIMRYHYSL
jgi:hypothetical protein